MDISDKLVAERRARLAAERSLEQMKSELYQANETLSKHARNLSTEIQTTQQEVVTVREEAADLQVRYEKAETNLRNAKSAITIAERRLWDSLETIRDGFAVFGPDELLIAANRSYLAIFDGLEMVRPGISLEELFSLLAEEGIVDTHGKRAKAWKDMMLARCRQHRIENAVLKIWNGTYIKLVDRRTRDGDLVTLALNITDQMIRERQLREASERAEAANRAKSAFLANMSHEIRTPMNGVIGMADILAETELDEEQKSYIDTIRTSGEALLVIINDVLDYSKIEAEKVNLKPKPFDLERCIHDVVTLLSPTAREKGFEIAVDYDLFMPTEYVGDAGRLRQVLTNLVGNAIKFTSEGHVTIQVVGLPGEEEGEYRIHVTIEDTGIGIPEDKLDDIFREFQQVENERDRSHDGTGLGLAITQRLIRLMQGDVWVDSVEDEGSVFGFHITLPVVTEVDANDIVAPSWMNRAIVIDRDGMNRSILIKQLGLMGLRSEVAGSLAEVSELRPGQFDVVLIGADADENVVEAAEAMRERFDPAAIFLLSDPGRGPRGHVAFNGSLQRPVLRSDITRSLNSVVQPAPAESQVEDWTIEQEQAPATPEFPAPSASDAEETPPLPEQNETEPVELPVGEPAADMTVEETPDIPETVEALSEPLDEVASAEELSDIEHPHDLDIGEPAPSERAETAPECPGAPEPAVVPLEETTAPEQIATEPAVAVTDSMASFITTETSQEVSLSFTTPEPSVLTTDIEEPDRDEAFPVVNTLQISTSSEPEATDAPTGTQDPAVLTEDLPDASFDATEPEFQITEPDAPAETRTMRVLVAEDNATNRMVIEKMMKSLNIDLTFAENGLEAVEHFQWRRPDILFTDISMPKMDGKEAARQIREIEEELSLPPCPIVAITAHAMEGDADEILAAGIDHYLTKPIKKSALTEHILAAQPEGTEPVLEDAPVAASA